MVGRSGFWADLAKAFRACIRAPMLPLLSVLIFVPTDVLALVPRSETGLLGAVELLNLLTTLFSIGFLGTQRIWFQRIFEGHTLRPSEVWRTSWKFFGRYLILGLIVGIPAFVAIVWLATQFLSRDGGSQARHFIPPIWWNPFWLIYGFVLDVLLTFVTPALAYTTSRVREAWSIGMNMITRTWPQSAAYVFVPPLTLLALAALNPGGIPEPAAAMLGIISILVGLLVKGSIAAFYLRQAPAEPARP